LVLLGTGLFVTTVALAATIEFITIFTNPLAGPVVRSGHKVAAFVVSADESMRRGPEDNLVAELRKRGVNCVAGYTVVPREATGDKEKAKELFANAGITGVVVMRILGEQERKQIYGPRSADSSGPFYPGFWSYWNYAWPVVASPGYLSSEKVYTVETLVYLIEKDELIWGAISEPTSPKEARTFIAALVKAAGKEMRKAGVVLE